jgi:hypothetical protein
VVHNRKLIPCRSSGKNLKSLFIALGIELSGRYGWKIATKIKACTKSLGNPR